MAGVIIFSSTLEILLASEVANVYSKIPTPELLNGIKTQQPPLDVVP